MGQPSGGDDAWLEALYRRFGTLVFRRARRLLGDEQAALDATQEVFVRALQARPELDEGERKRAAVSWFYVTTTNHCLNQLRDDRRRARWAAERAELAPDVEAPQLTAALLLKSLPDDVKALAVYYYLDEMSQAEIAAVIGTSQRTVSERLKDLRVRLQRALEERRAVAS
jgi:RNA polymerase sigma-70 factor, ECF subfamily